MTRSQEQGRHYLAGFVIAASIVYLAITAVISAMAWRDTSPRWLLTNLLALGVIPSLAAFALGRRAWSARSLPSAGYCAAALIILIVAMAVWQLFVVSF